MAVVNIKIWMLWDCGSTVVKVLCYKSEGLIPAGVIGIFHWHKILSL